LRLPVNRVQLHIPEGTLTYKLPRTIRNQRTEPPLLAKMMKDNPAWSVDTVRTIDLQVHGRAVNRHEPRMNTVVKYLHDLLSVGENVNRYDAKYTHQCVSCQQDNETMKHLLMCPAQSRKEWRCPFMTHIRKHLAATETNLELMTIALDGIQTVLNPTWTTTGTPPPATDNF
jgi:hypothetical protein